MKFELTGDLANYVQNYDFTSFTYATLDDILDDHRRTAYWASRFGGLLPPPPAGTTPDSVAATELIYVAKLLEVYAEATGNQIDGVDALINHPHWNGDLRKQRERFYGAEAFMAHYRDQTEPGTIEDFSDQIFDAIDPQLAETGSGLERLTRALTASAHAVPANVLTSQAKVGVKQGVCHQLANAGRVVWKV